MVLTRRTHRWVALVGAVAALGAVLAGLAGLAGCGGGGDGGSGGKPVVLATIFAYYDAARAIGGDAIEARILVKEGMSPHEYQVTPDDLMVAARAKLYIKNGLGLDDRFDNLLEKSSAKVLDISKVAPKEMLVRTVETSLGGGMAEPSALNPHIWLDPTIQMAAAEKIRDALSAMDPAHQATFEANAKAYLESLRALDQEFKDAAAKFTTKEFIGFHPAYDYLARRYGLRQIASIEEVPGTGLSVEQAGKVIQLIEEHHIRYIALETALSGPGADMIKEKTGVKTITLQPLETYDSLKETYVSLMRQNLRALQTALGG